MTEDEILTWDIGKLWNGLKQITEETIEYEKQEKEVKQGINLKIPIWYLINEWYEIHPTTNRGS